MPPHKSHYFLDSQATTSYFLTTEYCEVLVGPFSDSVLTSKFLRYIPRAKEFLPGTVTQAMGEICLQTPLSFPKALPDSCPGVRTLLYSQFQSPCHATPVMDTLLPPWKKSGPHQIILPCDTFNSCSGLILSYLFNLSLFFHLLFALCLYQDSFFLLSHKYCGHTGFAGAIPIPAKVFLLLDTCPNPSSLARPK